MTGELWWMYAMPSSNAAHTVVIFVTEQAQDCVVVQTVIQIEVPEAMSFAVDGVYAIQDCTYHEYGIIGHDGAVHPLFLQLCINVCFPGG